MGDLQLIGEGRLAEVFAWGDTKVIKLFAAGRDAAVIEAGARDSQIVHKGGSGRITTHYSAPDFRRLVEAVGMLEERRPATVLRVASGQGTAKSRKTPAKLVPQKTVIDRGVL